MLVRGPYGRSRRMAGLCGSPGSTCGPKERPCGVRRCPVRAVRLVLLAGIVVLQLHAARQAVRAAAPRQDWDAWELQMRVSA